MQKVTTRMKGIDGINESMGKNMKLNKIKTLATERCEKIDTLYINIIY